MGLVDRDDGWRMPDWLWERIEPLAGAAAAPAGLPQAACARPKCDGCDPARAQDGDAVECAQRERNLLLQFGASALSGVGAGRRVCRVLAAGAVGVRPDGR